ncbi:MAG: hypothetical protein GY786_05250 [Proteobacteria bacterium]|nr:hypothetical protein [Pseudomonadota bacterium]
MAEGPLNNSSSIVSKISGFITDIKGKKTVEAGMQDRMIDTLKEFITSRGGKVGYSDQFGFEYKYEPETLTSNPFLSAFPTGCFFFTQGDDENFFHFEISLNRILFYGIVYALLLGILLPLFGAPPETFKFVSFGGVGTVIIFRLIQVKKFREFLQKIENKENLDQY